MKQEPTQYLNKKAADRSEGVSSGTIRFLHRCFRCFPLKWIFRTPNPGKRTDPLSFFECELSTAPLILAQTRGLIEFSGKKVLDIGCGVGGKSIYFALHGASEVVAIDLDAERIARAVEFAGLKRAVNIEFVQADAACLRRSWSGRFDLVTMIDTFEHLDEPAQALSAAFLALKDGGLLLIGFPPYKSPWGAHLFDRISVPWVHLLLSEDYLVDLWKSRRPDAQIQLRIGSSGKLAEMDRAKTISEIRHLNGMTIARFESLVAGSDFRFVDCRFHSLLRIFTFLIKRLSIREYLTIRVMAVLKKAKGVSS